jgi:hypothetical protein
VRLRHWIAPNIHYLTLPIILARIIHGGVDFLEVSGD